MAMDTSPSMPAVTGGVCGGSALAALLRAVADGFLSIEEAVEKSGLNMQTVELYLMSPLTLACLRVRNR